MKKYLVLLIALMTLSVTAFAQSTTTTTKKNADTQGGFTAQSISYETTSTALNVLWLRDGFDNFAAFALPVYTFGNTQGKLKLNSTGAFDPNDVGNKAYVGAALSYDAYDKNGYKLTVYGGVKGLDLNDGLKFQSDKKGWVFGLGISIPFGSK
jgi:hypothetical protein